jgi:hypothetical protein
MTEIEEIENCNIAIPNKDSITEKSTERSEPYKDPVSLLLEKYPKTDDPFKNFELAKQFIQDNYRDSPRLDVVIYNLKKHFEFNTDDIAILKMFWSELLKSRKESQETSEAPKESQEAKKRKDKEAQEERERVHNEKRKKKEERKTEAEELYKIFENADDKNSLKEIRETKEQIREVLMQDFWSIQGRNPKTNNPGYVVLQKLAIADYLRRTFSLVRVGGQIWRYNWRKGYYVYDAENGLLHKEIGIIMNEVGNRDEGYTYNGNIIADKADIIEMASYGNNVFIDTESPFNKQIALNGLNENRSCP